MAVIEDKRINFNYSVQINKNLLNREIIFCAKSKISQYFRDN